MKIQPIKLKHTHTEDGVESDTIYLVPPKVLEVAEKLNEVIEHLNKHGNQN